MAPGRDAELVVVGELNPDIVVSGVRARSGPDDVDQVEQLVPSTTATLGSSAAITATAAARAGASVALIAVVGDDSFGRLCRGWVEDAGVDVGRVRVDPDAPTGSTVILVDADAPSRRWMLTHLGAMAALRTDDVDLADLPGARHVHLSSFFMHTGAREDLHRVFRAARREGRTTSLDTNDDPDDTWDQGAQDLLRVTDLLFCNEREAAGLAGSSGADPVTAAGALLRRLAAGSEPRLPAVVLKQGAAGAQVVTGAGAVVVSAPVVDVVDTVGAGDTLAGTVLAALLSGADWPEALRLGVAAGSLSTTAAGGTSARPDHAAVRALARTIPFQDSRTVRTQP